MKKPHHHYSFMSTSQLMFCLIACVSSNVSTTHHNYPLCTQMAKGKRNNLLYTSVWKSLLRLQTLSLWDQAVITVVCCPKSTQPPLSPFTIPKSRAQEMTSDTWVLCVFQCYFNSAGVLFFSKHIHCMHSWHCSCSPDVPALQGNGGIRIVV